VGAFGTFSLMAGIGIGLMCAGWITHPKAGFRTRLLCSWVMALVGSVLLGIGISYII